MKSYRNLASINEIKLLNFPSFAGQNGILTVLDNIELVPFKICRIFTVSAEKDSIRGRHAHKECTQLLICVSGSIEVLCDDGFSQSKYVLDSANLGLMVPPGVWAQEIYLKDNTVLMALCDLPYDADDYINDIEQLIKLKQNNNDK
jgi:dTDP-4-dehydrorhamnose 3,5-epimerase-like enzyme